MSRVFTILPLIVIAYSAIIRHRCEGISEQKFISVPLVKFGRSNHHQNVNNELQRIRRSSRALNIENSTENRIYLKNSEDIICSGPIYIGDTKNEQQFMVIFDTGSSDLWILSKLCASDDCQNHNRYNSSASDDYEPDGREFKMSYGSGRVSGFTSNDTIRIGSSILKNQTFGEVSNVSGSVISDISDGIFGLGFPSNSRTDDKSPIDRMKSQGIIERRIFCFILNHLNNSSNVRDEIQFGDCQYKPTTYLPLTQIIYWQFNMSAVVVEGALNGSDFYACKETCEAIMDSGTSFIGGPNDDVEQINRILGVKTDDVGNNFVDCDVLHLSKLPNITFAMGGENVTLTSNDYIVKIEDGQCLSGFMPMSIANSNATWVLGDVFMRARVILFDMDQLRLGIASKHSST